MQLNNIYNMDCLTGLQRMGTESIGLVVTSPPYYNARDYSHWSSVETYMSDMRDIFSTLYVTLKNHRYVIINVGDIVAKTGSGARTTRKLPLGAMFTMMMEDIGFEFVDDYIWDKGEPQTKRHLGNPQYPFYQYPVNCYEHILVFVKHRFDKTRIPCPDCGSLSVRYNGKQGIGVASWECANPDCHTKSENGRGKRFSERSIMMNAYQTDENFIEKDFIQTWRRDIVRVTPVIKIDSKGINKVGHSAPFPEEIPEMAIRYFSGVGDLVVDIFSGSGTTCKVAKQLGRKYIGFEINEEYCELSRQRLANETEE